MIRISKPTAAPAVLLTEGKNARRANSRSYSLNPRAFQSGTKKFSFRERIYAAPEVKVALDAAQHGKCCFCERLIKGESDVEHFRPKRGWQQQRGGRQNCPGYYWLAYEWENLYLSCGPCNSRFKRNLFPLENPSRRAKSHRDDSRLENPLFIDPGNDDPAEHISFRSEIPYALSGSRKGKHTLEALRLGERPGLNEARLQRLKLLKRLSQIVVLAETQPNNAPLQAEAALARAALAGSVDSSSEFAAAARAAIASSFRYVPD
jgi:uncharacterized protein (TIGR02646 family)